MRRFNNLLVVVLFLAAIATPLVANLRGIDGADAVSENRTLAPFPSLAPTWEAVAAFGPELDAWFADHFGYRSWLVRWYSESRYFGLKVSPVSTALIGKSGWLFYADDGALEEYTNEKPYNDQDLTTWRETILRERDWCRARGIGYVFTMPPDKSAIYPEYFPSTVRQLSPISRTDQVLTAAMDTGVMVDVRPAILAGKRHDRLYHVTDTHWNQRGAFLAYQQIIEAVRAQVPGVPPAKQRSDFEPASRTILGLDLAGMMGLKRSLTEEDLQLRPRERRTYVVVEPAGAYATSGEGRIVTEIPGSTLPRAVMFRDSYTSWLAPFLSEHFSRIVYLWENDFDARKVSSENPDVVIHEIVGRHLYTFYPTPWLIPDP